MSTRWLCKRPVVLTVILALLCQISLQQSDFEAAKDETGPEAEAGNDPDAAPEPDADESGEEANITAVLADIKGGELDTFAAVASEALTSAWNMFLKNDTEDFPILKLLEAVELTAGEERLAALRILELMDSNQDGKLTKDEFIGTYGPAMSTPDQAIELLYRIYDYNLDGFISVYETMFTSFALEGINYNIFDKWSSALHEITSKDVDDDRRVNLHEFMLDTVLQFAYGLSELKSTKKSKATPEE